MKCKPILGEAEFQPKLKAFEEAFRDIRQCTHQRADARAIYGSFMQQHLQ